MLFLRIHLYKKLFTCYDTRLDFNSECFRILSQALRQKVVKTPTKKFRIHIYLWRAEKNPPASFEADWLCFNLTRFIYPKIFLWNIKWTAAHLLSLMKSRFADRDNASVFHWFRQQE